MADEPKPQGAHELFAEREKRMRYTIGMVIFMMVAVTAWAIWNYYG